MAEREGFEPPMPVKARPLSRRVHSTTLPPLRPTTVLLQSSIFPGAEAVGSLCSQGNQNMRNCWCMDFPSESSTGAPGTGFTFGSPQEGVSWLRCGKRGRGPGTQAGIGQTPVAGKPAIAPANTHWLWRKRAPWFHTGSSLPKWAQNGASLGHNDA